MKQDGAVSAENSAQCIIDIRNVSKYYKMGGETIKALDGVSIQIEKGEVCCILGTSGSGKSTLLNLMAGLEKPTKGEIIIKKTKVHKLNEKQLALFRQKNIGFVFQSYNLLSTLTALENVTLPLIFTKMPKKKRDQLAHRMLENVGLDKRWRHKPSQMSGGQQQRVSIARAFINNPEVVFADEPTGNLDTNTSLTMMSLMKQLAHEHSQTLVIVTHDPEMAKYATKIVRIKDGHVEGIEKKEAEPIVIQNEIEAPAAEQPAEQEALTAVQSAEPEAAAGQNAEAAERNEESSSDTST